MKNYRKLGEIVKLIDERNKDEKVQTLIGVSIVKCFIKSVANTIGTDFSKYKIVKKGQFTYIPDTSRRGDKIGIALLTDFDEGLVSNIYTVFEITDTTKLLPEYLMLWFSRPEFDRYARYKSHGSVREIFDWDEMCRVELPIPDIKVQQKIVDAYNSITKRIKIKQKINENLEKTAQTIYNKTIESNNENESMYMTTIIKNGFPFDSDFFNENKNGLPLIRIRDIKNCTPIVYTTEDFSRAEIIKSGDLLVGMDGEFSPNFWFGKDSLLNQRVCKLSPSNDNVHIFFIYFSIKPLLEKLEKTQGGTTVIHVGKKDFDKINFPRLSIKEHKCFYNNVNSSFRLLIKNKNEILKLQELKQLVISRISGM